LSIILVGDREKAFVTFHIRWYSQPLYYQPLLLLSMRSPSDNDRVDGMCTDQSGQMKGLYSSREAIRSDGGYRTHSGDGRKFFRHP
jgi:hypothetical protein